MIAETVLGTRTILQTTDLSIAASLCNCVPKVLERDGFVFFFYSNEHHPIHVHVRRGGGEAVFDMEPVVELRESQGFKLKELARAEALALEYREWIISKWHEHLDR